VDPLWEMGKNVTPYQYGHLSLLTRIDNDGFWDVEVHFCKDRSQNPYGVLNVKNNKGEVVYSMLVKGTGIGGHDRLKTNNDTPTGVYEITGWLYSTETNRKSYGPNPRLALNGKSGEITKSRRTDIRVHGGRQEVKDKNGNWVPLEGSTLMDTHGCMRVNDSDMKSLKSVTDQLEKNNSNESPGTLTVTNDCEEPNTPKLIQQYTNECE